MSRAHTSRPKASVPSRCCALGGDSGVDPRCWLARSEKRPDGDVVGAKGSSDFVGGAVAEGPGWVTAGNMNELPWVCTKTGASDAMQSAKIAKNARIAKTSVPIWPRPDAAFEWSGVVCPAVLRWRKAALSEVGDAIWR